MKILRKLLLVLGLVLVAVSLIYLTVKPKPTEVLTEEERESLAIEIVKNHRLPGVEETMGEAAQRSEEEGFSITWYVRHVDGDWYKVWFTGVSPDGRRCGSAYFYVNIATREVFVERVAEIGV